MCFHRCHSNKNDLLTYLLGRQEQIFQLKLELSALPRLNTPLYLYSLAYGIFTKWYNPTGQRILSPTLPSSPRPELPPSFPIINSYMFVYLFVLSIPILFLFVVVQPIYLVLSIPICSFICCCSIHLPVGSESSVAVHFELAEIGAGSLMCCGLLWVAQYTNKEIHKYTNTQVHKYTNTKRQIQIQI